MDALSPAWARQSCWRLLDTHFSPEHLVLAWTTWQADPMRPEGMHFVGLCQQVPSAATWASLKGQLPAAELSALVRLGEAAEPGFHRCTLAQGRWHVTLCVGELQAQLREQRFEADTVWMRSPASWDRWQLKALAGCCRRGTQLAWWTQPSEVQPVETTPLPGPLAQAGFVLEASGARYDPPWVLKTSRRVHRLQPRAPGRCAVVGAGLAGASVAAALARRGWQVQVLDAAPEPAQGASGLPVGLVVPHVSADDSPRSQLSRAGVRLMLQEAARLLLTGQDWEPSGVLELRLDGHANAPSLSRDGLSDLATLCPAASDQPLQAAWLHGCADRAALWHTEAGWIRPARLVAAWLAQPGVSFRRVADVATLQATAHGWALQDAQQNTLAEADVVVLANAGGAASLLQTWQGASAAAVYDGHLPPVHGMRGLLSWGVLPAESRDACLPFPVNGHGSLITGVPTPKGPAWYAGATYEQEANAPADDATHHASNLSKLTNLLPQAAQALAPMFAADQVRAWRGTRCVSADRLPLVGPLDGGERPTLWISAAMGSRGLSFAMLSAELLAAQLGGEPWPVPASLARFLWARRAPAPSSSLTKTSP